MRQVIKRGIPFFAVAAMLLILPQLLFAQNSITALNVSDTGIIKIEFAQPLTSLPSGFTLENPSRIALDFVDTTNSLGRAHQNFTEAGLQSANIIQAGKRTRLILNLNRMLAYNTRIEGGSLLVALQDNAANIVVPGAMSAVATDAAPAKPEDDPAVLRFDISGYALEGATLLTQAEIDAAVAPFTGKDRDFSDVQRALEAVEDAYAKRGFSAVRVLLPEQELEKGAVRFRVVESHFGNITVKDNNFFSEANALYALPSLRGGGVPRAVQIARELRLANENPARQMNVVLKAGQTDEEVDASVIVTDSKPSAWGMTLDNTGTQETGRTRFGMSYRHANLFDADHVGSLQFQMSPEYSDRVTVLGAGYKIPLYQQGNSLEFSGGYSNVNSVVGGLSNFQGGGLMFSARFNHPMEKMGIFEPRLAFGLDLRDFKRIEQTSPSVNILYNEIVVMPLSVAYSAQGKLAESDLGFNAVLAANQPGMRGGKTANFANYDQAYSSRPEANYRVLRYGANYSTLLGDDWQFRAVLNGQHSSDALVQGEQMRLGGVDAVRGFSEGSENGESGRRWNLEGYTPDFGKGTTRARALVFFDAGEVETANGVKSSISAAGLGLRASIADQFSLRTDAGRIINAGNDPLQPAGHWRVHVGLSATF